MSSSRSFAFTLNNYDDCALAVVDAIDCRYMIYGKEVCPTTGTPHLQGFVYFKTTRTRVATSKKFLPFKPHLEIAVRSSDENIVYCSKGGDVTERGDRPKTPQDRGKATQVARAARNAVYMHADLKEAVKDGLISFMSIPGIKRGRAILAQERPEYKHDDVRGVWFYGPPRTGKSCAAFELYPGAYRKAQNKWFDEYAGQDVIILDDLDSEALGHHIKLWTDRYPVMGETKFGHTQLCHKKFVITSNYSPEELFKDPVMAEAIRARCTMRLFTRNQFNPYSMK